MNVVISTFKNIRARLSQMAAPPPPAQTPAPSPPPAPPTASILDSYVHSAPSAQNAIDIFKGEWASRLPKGAEGDTAGYASLFEDARIEWAIEALGGVKDAKVLELGPLEAGHTYMLLRASAASVTAVEANTRAYLKCLIAKELLGLDRAHFLCGDFAEYLKRDTPKFDVAVASGVLYHMRDPVELLALLAKCSDRIMLWTHYYDEDVARTNDNMKKRIRAHEEDEHEGFRYTRHRYEYLEALQISGFCGGSAAYASWLSRDDIRGALRHFGYSRIVEAFDDRVHPNGPAFALVAERSA